MKTPPPRLGAPSASEKRKRTAAGTAGLGPATRSPTINRSSKNSQPKKASALRQEKTSGKVAKRRREDTTANGKVSKSKVPKVVDAATDSPSTQAQSSSQDIINQAPCKLSGKRRRESVGARLRIIRYVADHYPQISGEVISRNGFENKRKREHTGLSTTGLAQPITKPPPRKRPKLADIPLHNADVYKTAEAIIGARVLTGDPFIDKTHVGPWIDEAWADARAASHNDTGLPSTIEPDDESRDRVWPHYSFLQYSPNKGYDQ